MQDQYEIVVVGGGAAGLSGAVALARARRSVLVVDDGTPRNAPAGHVHNLLGQEGTPPADLLTRGRSELGSYGGEVVDDRVDAVADLTDEDGIPAFEVTLAGGARVRARRLLVATGLADELPDLPGLAARWGKDVLHCPYCHGWEVRDRPIAVLATGPLAVHQALLFRQLSADIVLLTHTAGPPAPEDREQLAARGITLVDGVVSEVLVEDDRLVGVRLADGTVVPRAVVVVGPRFAARAAWLSGLGLAAVERRLGEHVLGTAVPADAAGATAVPGVRVAGNVTDLSAQVVVSAAAGLGAAAALNAELVAEDVRIAVAEHRQREAFWEDLYRARDGVWSGRPNRSLVEQVARLEPGTALDLGCGEGADAVWLAQQGWTVTGVDLSPTALARAAEHARAAGVDGVQWQAHDLDSSFPAGRFDLVSACFLHSPVEVPGRRAEVLRAAASAVAPGGTLLVVGHVGAPSWQSEPDHPHVVLPLPDEVLADLRLDPSAWRVETCATTVVPVTGPDGEPGTREDGVVRATRLA